MAKHKHTTPCASVSSPLSGRRALAAGALLTLLGASAADAAVTTPDAELIRLCSEFDVLERRYQTAIVAANTFQEEAEAEIVADAVREQQAPLLDRICTMPCTTMAGASALAASLLLWDGEIYIEEDDQGADTDDRLLAALLRAALGRAS